MAGARLDLLIYRQISNKWMDVNELTRDRIAWEIGTVPTTENSANPQS